MTDLNKAQKVCKVPKLIIRMDWFCESIPWQCDFGTNIYEVKICSSKNADFYVFAKRSTFMTELRHGSTETRMSPAPDPTRVGETTITFYFKNKKTGKCICYRDCDVTGDLGSINFLQREEDIDEDVFVVGDVSQDSVYEVGENLKISAVEDINYDKDPVTLKEVIRDVTIEEFINTYVHDSLLKEILISKFSNDNWTQFIHTDPQIIYNQDYCVIQGADEESPGCPQNEWYNLFLHQKQYNDMGISHLRIPLSQYLGTWFLPFRKQTWSYKEKKALVSDNDQ